MWQNLYIPTVPSSSICIDGTITESGQDGNKDDMGLQTSSDFTLVGSVS